jgi:hypothetical protein
MDSRHTPPPAESLDDRLAALKLELAAFEPPPSTDRAITTAADRASRKRRRPALAPRFLERWFAWPVALAASIGLVAVAVRQMPADEIVSAPTAAASIASPRFMPVVPVAEIERSSDAYVVPAARPAHGARPVRPAGQPGARGRGDRHRASDPARRRRARAAVRQLMESPMNRPPFLTTLLAAALAGSAAVALAQQPAPKAATPSASLEAEIERFTREAETYRWEMLAQAAEFDVDVDPDGPSFAFIAREFGSMREIVKNAPYQAEAVNEVVQTLNDGNRIVRRSSAQVARDGYGRTRQERKGGTAYIFDPIENRSYALNPERKSAVRIPRAPSLIAPPAPPTPPAPPAALAPVPPVPPVRRSADPACGGRDARAEGDRARHRQARRRQGRRGAHRGRAHRPRREHARADADAAADLAADPAARQGRAEAARHARVRRRQGRWDDDQLHDPGRPDRQREADRGHERALVLARAARRRVREEQRPAHRRHDLPARQREARRAAGRPVQDPGGLQGPQALIGEAAYSRTGPAFSGRFAVKRA